MFQTRVYKYGLIIFLSLVFSGHGVVFGSTAQKIDQANEAVTKSDLPKAEKILTEILKQNTNDYRVLKPLLEVKMRLGKYKEAKSLIDRALEMEVSSRRKVLVYLNGQPEPLGAELIDEVVVSSETGKNNMRNYLDPADTKPVEQYRLFFFESGEIKLVPKSQTRIKYLTLPRPIYDEVVKLKAQVENKLVATVSGESGEMAELKGGCFLMGSNKGEVDEAPMHEVCISPFKIDRYEVSQRNFLLSTGDNPSRFRGPLLPVDSVTWVEADAYCKKQGRRLPTEAEWEYAVRGGTSTEYYWGDKVGSKQANFCDSYCELNLRLVDVSDGFKHTAPIGSFAPNPFGLYDMSGNVSEWVSDWMMEGYYRVSPKNNPKGPGYGEWKVVRGGAWENDGFAIRSANRKGFQPDYRIEGVGFRCAADLK